MGYNDDILKRTELKYFGTYIQSGATPGPAMLEREITAETLTGEAYGVLERLVDPLPSAAKILSAAVNYGAALEQAGFLSGLRAGARLMLRLTDDRPILY